MSDLIIIRLVPATPVTGLDFTNYLKGLKIVVTDMSFQNPKGTGNVIGSAFYDPLDATSTIVQHIIPAFPFPPAAVATAAIVITEPAGYKEYETADLRLTITRGVAPNVESIVDQSVNYNATIDKGGVVPGTHDPTLYAVLGPTALYLSLPDPGIGLDPNRAHVNVPTDGSPPNYDELLAAVLKVVGEDPGAGSYNVAALTPLQSRHIANEIIANRDLNPLPLPPDTLEELYTQPAAAGLDNDRKKFEADLTTYYTTTGMQAEVLAKYVFGVSAALACEILTNNVAHVGFAVPVLPGTGSAGAKIAEMELILS
jgi:hypothetical protein